MLLGTSKKGYRTYLFFTDFSKKRSKANFPRAFYQSKKAELLPEQVLGLFHHQPLLGKNHLGFPIVVGRSPHL